MDFPITKNKYTSKPLFTPAEFNNYLNKPQNNPDLPIPEAVILCYQSSVVNYTASKYKMIKSRVLPGHLLLPECFGGKLGILNVPGCGAPVTVIFLEELIAFGIKKFISFGTAGALQKEFNLGDIIVCDKALRDEGTSYHYLPADRYSYPSGGIVQAIEQELSAKTLAYKKGAAWTTDAPFMETKAEVENYQKEGILAVDMEAAALFAVAEYRKVELGVLFIISDKLANFQWEPGFFNKNVVSSLNALLEISFSILLNY